jgi:pimeloyl-ACP methyl ester carboxylesterase
MKYIASALVLSFLTACTTTPDVPIKTIPAETAIIFEAESGATAEAFEGQFIVPENRANPNSRMLTVKYVRFPSTSDTPGAPIIYLSGGPGGSGIGTAKWERFPLFMAMREFGDVIALDQRGTGASNDMETCNSSYVDSDTALVSDRAYIDMKKAALAECYTIWDAAGIDIAGYNTVQNAADLDDLRMHLGSEKVTLWGISYGSHLTFAALKQMDDRIDRVVIASGEGLDQTIKQPARGDAYFGRLQAAIDKAGLDKPEYDDIIGLIRRVNAKLDAQPIMLSIPMREGEPTLFLLQRRDMQQFTSGMISDPQWAMMLLDIYAALDRGETAPVVSLLQRWVSPNAPISFRPMPIATDIASGTGPARRAILLEQAKTAITGRYLNHEVELENVRPELNLGPDFRSDPVSDVPVLLLSGTLDGRTYIESQREAVAGLRNVKIVTVENAGHNLFMSSPEVTATIQAFMRGEDVSTDTITIPFPPAPASIP